MDQILPIVGGAAGVVGLYLAYLAATKGAPAAWAAVSTWWTAGKTELATLKGDIAEAHAKIAALQTNVAGITGPVAALQTDVSALKAKVGA
jgi:hypothetical protein